MTGSDTKYFRKGFGLKDEVVTTLDRDYHSRIIDALKAAGNSMRLGRTTIQLAKEFGFCYGVDRSVEYAYQTLQKFPGKRVYLTGEIIHNPFVNKRLIEMGVRFLSGPYGSGETLDDVTSGDIVILPAFGVSIPMLNALREKDCVLVDTTCGSVLLVWKHVERFSREGFTALVHGKYYHEETIATVSRTAAEGGGKYIIVRDLEEAEKVCAYIRSASDRTGFMADFSKAVSPGFDPDRDLVKIGVANQTTMLASESLRVAEMVKQALRDRYGEEKLDTHFRAFDTICSATQERQDAIRDMLEEGNDLTIVIGGFNSSNTKSLTSLALKYNRAYHIEEPSDLIDATRIKHLPPGASEPVFDENWLPAGQATIGFTAGASTPNARIGEIIERILSLRGETLAV
jgi:4-hydroxy-3-methylbut-2-enyl diphosphate reductase